MIILLERSFSPKQLQKFQNQYSIKLPQKYSSNKEAVGLMVIKKVAKTKAFQKTSCIRNWQHFFKTVLALLKDNKYTAQQLLDVWANKDAKMIKSKKVKKDFNWDNYGIAKSVDRKPPLPVRFCNQKSLDSDKEIEKKIKKKDIDDSLLKKGKETLSANTFDQSSNSSSISSDKTTESFILSQPVNRFIAKKTFCPNQTSKIYTSEPEYDSQYNFSKKINISPARETSKLDLCDIRRPFSSSLKQNGEAYIKSEKLPKFAQKQPNLMLLRSESKSTEENLSIDSDVGMNANKHDYQQNEDSAHKESQI